MTRDADRTIKGEAYLRSIKPPESGQDVHYDPLVPSFALRVSAGGAMTWIVQRRVGGKPCRYKVGRYPAMGLADAREEARRVCRLIDAGKDPFIEAKAEQEIQRQRNQDLLRLNANTFDAVRKRFMVEYVQSTKADRKTPRLRKRSQAAYSAALHGKWFKDWESRPLSEITRSDVRMLLADVQKKSGGYAANRLLAYLRKMLNWSVSRDLIQLSPTTGIDQPAQEEARERVLNERELYWLWKAFSAAPVFEKPMKLLLVTAQRLSEVAGMDRLELENLTGNNPLWRIPKDRAKNARAHVVPLSPLAVEILGDQSSTSTSGLMFTTTGDTPVSGFSKAKEHITAFLAAQGQKTPDPAIDSLLADWRIHDFRRTARTCMAEIGVSNDVGELILNHKSGERAGVNRVYNRSHLMDERRIALEIWAKYLQRVTAERLTDQAIEALRSELRSEHRRRLVGDVPPRPQLQVVRDNSVGIATQEQAVAR